MGDAMKVMRNCTDDMLQYWGIDLEKHRNLAKLPEPIGNVGNWVRSRDYPNDLLRKGYQGWFRHGSRSMRTADLAIATSNNLPGPRASTLRSVWA